MADSFIGAGNVDSVVTGAGEAGGLQSREEPVRAWDTRIGYGWISIALHWLTAAVVIALWYTGSMSQQLDSARIHTTIALSAYALLWGRLIWRFAVGHPGPRPGQRRHLFGIGKYLHYLLVFAIGVMLVSGPLKVWMGGDAIVFYGFAIESPFGAVPELGLSLRRVHAITASVILAVTALHVLAVLLHTVVMRDGTFEKMMIADGAAGEGKSVKAEAEAAQAEV